MGINGSQPAPLLACHRPGHVPPGYRAAIIGAPANGRCSLAIPAGFAVLRLARDSMSPERGTCYCCPDQRVPLSGRSV